MTTKIDSYSMSHGFSTDQLKLLNDECKYVYRATISSEPYIKDELLKFCRKQEMKKALFKAYELLKEDSESDKSYEQVVSMFDNAVSVGMGADLGYEFDDLLDLPVRYNERYNKDTLVTTGFPTFDEAIMGGMGPGELHVFASVPKGGKCLAKGTKVIMFDGSLRSVEDIKIGDQLMGVDSTPRNVISLGSGVDVLYRVKQNYGKDYVINSCHILSLKKCDTKEIVDISVTDYLKSSNWFKSRHKGFKVGVEYQARDVNIDPYLVGVLACSNKSKNVAYIKSSKMLKEVISLVIEAGLSYKIKQQKNDNYKLTLVHPKNDRIPINFFNVHFEFLFQRTGKSIPEEYLLNTSEVRLKLLAGLLDCNSYTSINNIALFTCKHLKVCEQVIRLSRSLGFKCNFIAAKNKIYRIVIGGDLSKIPFLRPDAFLIKKSSKDVNVTGINIEHVGVGEYYGFELDGDGRFLLEDFTVTHNTTFGAVLGANALATGKTVYHATLEIKKDDLLLKYAAAITGLSIKELLDCDIESYQRAIQKFKKYNPNLFINYWTEGTASTLEIRSWISKKRADTGKIPSVILVDYDDCLIPTGKQTDSMYENSSQIYSDLIGLADYFKCPVVTLSQSKWESWSLPEKGELIQHCHLSHSSRKSHKAFTVSSLNFSMDSKYGILYLDIARRGTSKVKIPIYRDLGKCLIVENKAEFQ